MEEALKKEDLRPFLENNKDWWVLRNDDGRSLLHLALTLAPDSMSCVEQILQALVADYNDPVALKQFLEAQDDAGWTALHLAVSLGNLPAVEAILGIESLDTKALMMTRSRGHQTVVHYAAGRGRLAILEAICKYAMSSEGGKGPFLQHLLRAEDSQGQTALHRASSLNQNECVKFLIKRCPELYSICDKQGRLPVDLAIEEGHSEVVLFLQSYQS